MTSSAGSRPSLVATLKKSLASAALFFALIGGSEAYCRGCTRINFLDNSPDLFAANRFGESRGNLVNGRAVSFGETIYTDDNGFRIDPTFKDPDAPRAVLFLGDSVGFGTGVEESKIAAGLVRRALPDRRVYNSSVVGYWLKDYENVANAFLPAHPEVKDVYVLMCLNDIYDLSALEIKKRLGQSPDDADHGAVSGAKRVSALVHANDWLRSRSKLYLLIKNLANDTSMRIFQYDLQMYQGADAYFDKNMSALARLSEDLRAKGVRFKVVVLPYEVQLRPGGGEERRLPQRMITAYLRQHDIPYLDAFDAFQRAGASSRELFLYGDPMHFSPAGHRVLSELLLDDLRSPAPAPKAGPG
jgi:lysophospholipase L1-like esterase